MSDRDGSVSQDIDGEVMVAARTADPARVEGPREGLSSLHRGIGNRRMARLLQDRRPRALARSVRMPLQVGIPAGTPSTTLARFLEIIRAEEAKLPAAEQSNTKLMVTRLRKLFYGGQGWDDYLITGAKAVKPLYSWKETETSRVEIELPGVPNLVDYVEKKGSLVGAPAALADPSSIQEVLMPNGDFVDVGHVLAGLDALNYPATASGPLGTLSVASNVGAVTWIGDIASIVGEIIVKTLNRKKSSFTDAELQAEIDRMAPVQDMIGDIDAYVIGKTFAISSTSGAKVSDMLEQYYGGPGAASAAGAAARSKRFTIFTDAVGLGALSGGTFANETAWKATYLPQVQNASGLYMGSVTEGGVTGVSEKAGLIYGAASNPTSALLLDQFVAELKVKVAAESAGATATPGPSTPGATGTLQRALASTIGNRAMTQLARSIAPTTSASASERDGAAGAWDARTLARDAIDQQVPAGVTANAVAVPPGANLTDPTKSAIVQDPSLSGGWTDGATRTSSGRVGAIDRILLEGISGHQTAQALLSQATAPTGPGYAGAVGPAGKGRAVALVPHELSRAAAGPISVVIHFHGVKGGSWDMRSTGPTPEDVGTFQIPQQMEAYLQTHQGARLIVLCPIGVTTEAKTKEGATVYGTNFGLGDIDRFVRDCIGSLGSELPAGCAAGKVYLSAHSGGGLYVSQLLQSPSRLPSNFGGLFGFESWHGDVGAYETFIRGRMNLDLSKLTKLQADGATAGQTADQIAQAQIAYLRADGFRFVAFGGSGGARGYAGKARELRKTVLDWFASSKAALTTASAGRADVLNALWSNYQANFFAGSTHTNSLSQDNNFGRALASLDGSVPVTPSPPPQATANPGATPPPSGPGSDGDRDAGAPESEFDEDGNRLPGGLRPLARAPVAARDATPRGRLPGGVLLQRLPDPDIPPPTDAERQRAAELLTQALVTKVEEHRVNTLQVCGTEVANGEAGSVQITYLSPGYVRRALAARASNAALNTSFEAAVGRILGEGVRRSEWAMGTRAYAELPVMIGVLEQQFIDDPNASSLDLLEPDRSKHYRQDVHWQTDDYPGNGGPNESEATQMTAELAKARPERRANRGADRVIDSSEFGSLRRMPQFITSELVAVDGLSTGFMLNSHAAAAFVAARTAAARDGVSLAPGGGTPTFYRTPALAAANAAAAHNPNAVGKFSSHMLGLAVDLAMSFTGHQFAETSTRPMGKVVEMRQSPAHKWMFVRGATFGFYPLLNEPWHWEYNPPGFRELFMREYHDWLTPPAAAGAGAGASGVARLARSGIRADPIAHAVADRLMRAPNPNRARALLRTPLADAIHAAGTGPYATAFALLAGRSAAATSAALRELDTTDLVTLRAHLSDAPPADLARITTALDGLLAWSDTGATAIRDAYRTGTVTVTDTGDLRQTHAYALWRARVAGALRGAPAPAQATANAWLAANEAHEGVVDSSDRS